MIVFRLLIPLLLIVGLTSCSTVTKRNTQLEAYHEMPLAEGLQVPYPVILLHGLGQKSDVWRGEGSQYFFKDLGLKLGASLSVNGSNVVATGGDGNDKVGDVYVVQFSNPTDSINAWRDELEACVNFVRQTTKADKVVLIGYSMGGLAARAYLVKRLTDHHVKRLITVGTPHLGSAFAKVYNWKTGLQKCLQDGNIALTPICKTALASLKATEQDVIYDSPAIRDLRRPQDGGEFLRRLNVMTHPMDIEYLSVVGKLDMFEEARYFSQGAFQELIRKVISVVGSGLGEMFDPGDGVVSSESQDITNVEYFKLNASKQRAARTVGLSSLHVEHLHRSIEVQRITLDEKPEYKGSRFVLKDHIPTLVVEFSDYIPRQCSLTINVKRGSKLISTHKVSGKDANLLQSPTGIIAQFCISASDLKIEHEVANQSTASEPLTFFIHITNSFGYAAASYLTW